MFIMAKFLFIILIIISISTNISLGEKKCNHYDDENCVHPNILKNGHFVNQWTVYLPGVNKEKAKELLEENDFVYLGKIMDGTDLHLVTKKGTPEKHILPNTNIMELLKKHEKVHSVAQKHVIQNSPDEVFSIYDENDVIRESVDPNTIKLNDGSENLRRIQTAGATQTLHNTRPISRYHQPVDKTDQKNDAKTNIHNNNVKKSLTPRTESSTSWLKAELSKTESSKMVPFYFRT